MVQADFDVGIIGGGPGGSVAASYLAKAGLKCVVLERELFPREHVGESLVPASTRALKDIGFIDKMDPYGFVRKYGAVWTAATKGIYDVDFEGMGDDVHPQARGPIVEHVHNLDGVEPECRADIRFGERDQPGVDRNHTWHVDRGRFDLLLLQHAEKLGAAVYEGIRAREVDFSDPAMPRIKFSLGKQEMGLNVRTVIDASGRQTFLGNQLKLKQNDPVFDQYAIHTWFDNYDRRHFAKAKNGESHEDYIYIHFLPLTNTWVWQIPITETITSIGVVTQKKNFAKSRESREQFFWNAVGSRPDLHDALRAAKQLRPFKDEGDYSYAMQQICGDRFVMIGDAARFVDPIFSSGVSIAMTSAKLATQSIIKTAQNGQIFNKESFEDYQATMRRGTRNWYEFITVYYRLNVLFTAFIEDPKYRLDVLKLLQGDLYDVDDPPVLREMRRIVTDVERRPNHPWHKLLGDLTSEAFRPAF
ncbi:MAG TPA: NAD(P)/FAD-dependent oxidoreductase [Terriglobales bacterium]